MRKVHQVKWTGAVLTAALLVTACGDDDGASVPPVVVAPRIDVAGDTSAAGQIVAEIYAQAMENSGLRVARQAPIASRDDALTELQANQLQVYPDFLTSLLAHLSDDGTVDLGDGTTEAALASVNEVLPDTVSVGDPSAADNGLVVACGAAVVEERQLTTLTELFEQAADITIGGPADFETATPFGLAGFAADDVEFAGFTALDPAEIGPAIADGTVDCGVLPGLSAAIVANGLLTLTDESSLAPQDALVPLVATPALTPDVAALLAQVDQLLTTEILRALVVKVEIGGESVESVAKGFIASQASSGTS